MQPLNFYSTGQMQAKGLTTFSECIQANDYLTAFHLAQEAKTEKELFSLIDLLVNGDLTSVILSMSQKMGPNDCFRFLFLITRAYLIKENYPIFYDFYKTLNPCNRMLILKEVLKLLTDKNKQTSIIQDIAKLHKDHHDIQGFIEITYQLTDFDKEPVLFNLGIDLIAEKRFTESALIAERLTSKRPRFEEILTQAKEDHSKHLYIYA